MGIMQIFLWTILGLLVGAGGLFAFAGNDYVRDGLLRKILQSNRAGWVLTQRGTTYELDPVERDSDANCYKIGDGDDTEYVEDTAGMMHSLEGVPLGLRLEGERPIVDVETVESIVGQETKVMDGGEIEPVDGDEWPADPDPDPHDLAEFDTDELEDHFIIGKKTGKRRKILYVNPFTLRERIPDLVDLREAPKALQHDTDPDTPRKAAANAVEAERATLSDWGEVWDFAKYAGAFLLGGIATYMGTTASGGGGGGGVTESVDVGLTIAPVIMDIAGVML